MSTRDSPGSKGGRCVRLTIYHPCNAERQETRGLNLPGPPWAISTACCRRDLYLYLLYKTYNHIYDTKLNQENMKEAVILHMVCISSDNVRHPVTKIFDPLHYTSLHFTTFIIGYCEKKKSISACAVE